MENYKEITREELKKWMDEKKEFLLIDVLSQESYEAKHLPGAKHAAVRGEENFLKKAADIASTKDAVIVIYCASFTCQLSPLAASTLADDGYTNVYDFKGGLADWQDAEYPFEGEVAGEKIKSKCSCCN